MMPTMIHESVHLRTGSPRLDKMLQGGYLVPSIAELSGATGTGKSLLALTCLMNLKETPGCYIDAERRLDRYQLTNMDVDLSNLIITSTYRCKDIVEIIHDLGNYVSVFVLDSTAAVVDLDKYIGAIKDAVVTTKSVLLATSQVRSGISGRTRRRQYTTASSLMIAYHLDDRIHLTKQNAIVRGYKTIGQRVKYYVAKSRRAWPRRGMGYYRIRGSWWQGLEMVDVLLEEGRATRRGAHIEYEDKSFQGKYSFAKYLEGGEVV